MNHELIQAIKQKCLERGEFTLAGGAKSSYYLDLRKLTLSEWIREIGLEFHGVMFGAGYTTKSGPEAIGGPGFGAGPIVGACLFRRASDWFACPRGFLVRPAAKDHGKAGRIIGSVRPGDRCVLVDDVATSGGSLIDAADVLKEFGCSVVHAVVIVDRLAGARERLAEREIPLTALCTIKDLGIAQS